MAEDRFPPGPYIIGEPGGPAGPFWSLVNQQGNVVAMQITSEAAARLLKEAPDLLETLEELLYVQFDGDPLRQASEPTCRKAKAVIARARGEESYGWQLDAYEDWDEDEYSEVEDDELEYALGECGQQRDGTCLNAGTEYCDFECPFRDDPLDWLGDEEE